ncbi:hypothetical protein SAMN05216228_11115 [Rhizobium tibeticum]|uniref:Uncharacterized protein n=1 Tax=Rhizobium tibeticum TaxID=501024 RepID=A0A1H8X791_9HYPH|nr:hypothetical protein RTCCBAU85039_6841 [Rhizobium tibeticum]SEP35794.1 hypothetical protein SAMN05216228_11115 [Rhizobium tibeticum]
MKARLSEKMMEESAAHRQGRVARRGLQSRDGSAEPRQDLPKKPENRTFPVIQDDRHR